MHHWRIATTAILLQLAAALPGVPTIAEQGLPGYELDGWIAPVAPAGLPKAELARLTGLTAQQSDAEFNAAQASHAAPKQAEQRAGPVASPLEPGPLVASPQAVESSRAEVRAKAVRASVLMEETLPPEDRKSVV